MRRLAIAAAACALATTPASAQFDLSALGGLSGVGGGLVPSIGSVGVNNAAGLLGYCMKRKLLGGSDAKSILARLSGQPEIAGSKSFAAGQQGLIVSKQGKLSLDGVKDKVKGKVCNLVLDRAGSFLGR